MCEDKRAPANRERESRIEEREARLTTEARADAEYEARIEEHEAKLRAEARIRELEKEN